MYHGTIPVLAEKCGSAQIPKPYGLRLIEEPAPFDQDCKAWAIYTRKENDPVRIALKAEIEEYNALIEAVRNEPGFIDFFVQNGLAVTRPQIEECFSRNLADKLFTLKRYSFVQQLYVYGEWLFDVRSRPAYRLLPEELILPEHAVIIKNRTDDERDAAYFLCEHFQQNGLLPENVYSDSGEDKEIDYGYDWYDFYEQAREEMEHPDGRVVEVMKLLEGAGCLRSYSVQPKEFHPSWSVGMKSDCTIDVLVLDPAYLQDAELKEKICVILKSRD
ncbi:MAG: hypothetical protein IJ496_00910 [Ruminococcus sp.]|nr:hypothetical protein [Ruminococcus sp.]